MIYLSWNDEPVFVWWLLFVCLFAVFFFLLSRHYPDSYQYYQQLVVTTADKPMIKNVFNAKIVSRRQYAL